MRSSTQALRARTAWAAAAMSRVCCDGQLCTHAYVLRHAVLVRSCRDRRPCVQQCSAWPGFHPPAIRQQVISAALLGNTGHTDVERVQAAQMDKDHTQDPS